MNIVGYSNRRLTKLGDLTFGEPLYMLQNSEYVPWVVTIFDSVR